MDPDTPRIRRLRQLLATTPRSGAGNRFPEEPRAEVVAALHEARGNGASLTGLGTALGLLSRTLSRWIPTSRPRLRRIVDLHTLDRERPVIEVASPPPPRWRRGRRRREGFARVGRGVAADVVGSSAASSLTSSAAAAGARSRSESRSSCSFTTTGLSAFATNILRIKSANSSRLRVYATCSFSCSRFAFSSAASRCATEVTGRVRRPGTNRPHDMVVRLVHRETKAMDKSDHHPCNVRRGGRGAGFSTATSSSNASSGARSDGRSNST
jgi:lambda repressor-like predicted transcriptional regulator